MWIPLWSLTSTDIWRPGNTRGGGDGRPSLPWHTRSAPSWATSTNAASASETSRFQPISQAEQPSQATTKITPARQVSHSPMRKVSPSVASLYF